MPESTRNSPKTTWPITFLLSILAPVAVAALLYQLHSFDPAPIPAHELTRQTVFVPKRNSRMLHGSEKIGAGQLLGPEDIAYDPESRVFYTGCVDGWVKRVAVADSVVENWVNTGGRPLGIALGRSGDVIVADAVKSPVAFACDMAANPAVSNFTFCDWKKRVKERMKELVNNLNVEEKIGFMVVTSRNVSRFEILKYEW